MITRSLVYIAATLLVLAGVAIGVTSLLAHQPQSASLPQWPKGAAIDRAEAGYTLLVFAHPHCDCTQATLNELTHILEAAHGRVQTEILFYEPRNADAKWRDAEMIRMAGHIPGVKVRFDVGGTEARRFHIETSGHVLAFTPGGRLTYSGGITQAPGIEGDNEGRETLTRVLLERTAPHVNLSVFGCDLFTKSYTAAAPVPGQRS